PRRGAGRGRSAARASPAGARPPARGSRTRRARAGGSRGPRPSRGRPGRGAARGPARPVLEELEPPYAVLVFHEEDRVGDGIALIIRPDHLILDTISGVPDVLEVREDRVDVGERPGE